MARQSSQKFPLGLWVLAVTAILWSPSALLAQKVKEPTSDLDAIVFGHPGLRLPQQIVDSSALRAELGEGVAHLPLFSDYDAFLTREGGRWHMQVDRFSGRPALVEGSGIPWIPGAGNALTAWDLGLPEGVGYANDVPVKFVEERAREMIRVYPELFGVPPGDLELVALSSGPMLHNLYYLHFNWHHRGVHVENAYVVFRLNSGNLVQFGSEGINPEAIAKLDTAPSFPPEAAWEVLWGYLGGPRNDDVILDKGSLTILPLATPVAQEGFAADLGSGVEYRLVYTLAFRRPGVIGTWQAKVDAHTGEIISFLDDNRYGSIKGGVYKTDQPATEVSVPFPFADYSGSAWADQAGLFPGTTGTSTMTGRTGTATTVGGVDIVDSCGTISLAADGSGVINFGTSAATDCSSPGGGAGNTRAARTQYYNVSMIKIKAYTYLPGNNWLEGRLTDNVNLNQTCNAYWNGTSVNFFRKSSGDCWNTGELPGVSLHEWAHGLDSNDGSPAGDKGTGETYGDFSGSLQTHGSCAGSGFFLTWNMGCGTTTPGYNCGGYGNCCTSCSGIREIDYAKRADPRPTFPEDLSSNTCGGCTSFACSTSATYAGPCGREGHCESLVSSQAMWDLPVRDLVAWGMDIDSAWQLMDKLWYASRATSGKAYECPSVTTANGCGTSNYFTTFRVVDDCDGNLDNGTPHATAIYAAFNRHKIACTTAAGANVDDDCGCATLATPALSGTPGNNTNYLTWGAVSGASSYDVYRNDAGCTAGYTKVGNTASLSFTDTTVINGVTYYYRIQANGTGSCPPSPMSNCVTLTPIPCTTPGTPTIGTVTVPGNNQLQVSWTPGSPAGATYKVYRAVLADADANCTTGTYTFLASDTASPFVDNTVSGTVTYGYRVTAVDSTGGCESAQSGCAKATATGTCNMGPVFSGVTGITNPASATCTLNVGWSAATAYCGGPVTYTVYRSTTAPFTPGAGSLIASGISATSYSDVVGLASGTTYYYIVRATDTANGMQETNTVTQAGVPTGPVTTGTWTDDAGDTGTAKMTLEGSWSVLTTGGRTAPKVYATGAYGDNLCIALTTPALILGTNAVLSFASKYGIETDWDAGILQVATGPTFTTWIKLAITTYPNDLANAGNACGWAASGANTVFSLTNAAPAYPANPYTAALTAYNGQQVKIRWILSTDTSVNSAGWWVDDVSITNVQVPGTCTTGSGGCTAPGAPTLSSATGACAGVNLAWSAGSGTTLAYNIYRVAGACGGAYAKIAGPVAGTTYSDTTAVAGTSYAYVVRGTCDAGGATESANSNCLTATRLAAPAAPAGLSATGTCTAVNLGWTASSGATSYELWRTTNADCTTGAASVGTSATTTYSDTSAVAGTTYYYTVKAGNSCGTSGVSNCANAVRLAIPTAPGAPTFTAVGCSEVTVNWTAVSGATSYDVYRKAGANCGGAVKINAAPVVGASYPDSGLSPNTQYAYYIVAVSTCGSSADGACANVTTTGLPATPTGLSATGACGSVDLTWSAASGATSYEIWRTANADCTTGAASIGMSATTTYSDATAIAGTAYYYAVKGVNTCGTSAASTCASSAALSVTTAPGSVTATGTCADVAVSWGSVSGATSYNVLRGTVCGTALTTFAGVTSPYHDASAVAGTAYQYWVVAVNSCGTSADSSCASAARLVTPTPTITGAGANSCPATTVALSTESGQNSYQWYRGGSPISGANAYQYTVTQTGEYTVSYTATNGCSGTSAAKTVTIIPCVPNIVYGANGSWAQVYGNGDAVVDPGETWDVTVTLQNAGTGDATNVFASLTATGATFCTGTASYGAMATGATATGTFRFVVEGAFTCGNSLSFNVVGKTSTEGGYPDEGGAFTRQIGTMGSGTPEVATTAGFTLPVGSTTTRDLAPAFTIPEASAAAASSTYTATANSNKVTSALLRHLPSGNTVALGTPAGNNIPVVTDVTVFYQNNGPGTYQMQWTTGNGQAVTLANISLTVTPSATPICNIWSSQSCLSGPVPMPVPDGQWISGTPLAAAKANADGTTIDLTWGVPCPSTNYNVLYGNGSQVSSVTTSGSECPLGALGNYTWNSVPTIPGGETFLWWVIVGTDGSSTEGSWGKDSAGNERNGASASNRCGFTLKNTTGTCP